MINPNCESDYICERKEALFSLERNRIETYMSKYGEEEITSLPDAIFWSAVYKAICQIPNAPSSVVEKSRRLYEDALIEHLMTHGTLSS